MRTAARQFGAGGDGSGRAEGGREAGAPTPEAARVGGCENGPGRADPIPCDLGSTRTVERGPVNTRLGRFRFWCFSTSVSTAQILGEPRRK
jgi:hypothetical protein